MCVLSGSASPCTFDFLRGSTDHVGTIQITCAWPLRNHATRKSVSVNIFGSEKRSSIHPSITYAHTHTHIHTCTRTHTHTHKHMHTHTHTCAHTHTHTHTQTCTPTHTHTHTQTHRESDTHKHTNTPHTGGLVFNVPSARRAPLEMRVGGGPVGGKPGPISTNPGLDSRGRPQGSPISCPHVCVCVCVYSVCLCLCLPGSVCVCVCLCGNHKL